MIVFEEHLPTDVTGGVAFFGNLAEVTLKKQNEFNLFGQVPGESVLISQLLKGYCYLFEKLKYLDIETVSYRLLGSGWQGWTWIET